MKCITTNVHPIPSPNKWIVSLEGEKLKKKKCKRHKCHPKMNLCRKFHQNQTMANCSKNRRERFRGGGRKFGGEELRKKKTIVRNATPKWICRKIHPNQTMVKSTKIGVGLGLGEEEGKWKRHKCYPKVNLCRKFHSNRTMGKHSKLWKNWRYWLTCATT